MKKSYSLLCVVFWIWAGMVSGLAQTSGVLTGTVQDPQQGYIPGAEVVATEVSTNVETVTLTNDRGIYLIPNLPAGTYDVSVEVPGFKTAVAQGVKVAVSVTSTLNIHLEVGEISDSVVVEAATGLIERELATITSTVEGRQLTELPFTSREALDLALTQAGTQTPGRPSTSTVGGLRQGALNIQIDGIRVQDNYARSGSGFNAYISPRIDAVEEFSLTQAGQTAESAGEGAVQIRFVTKKGTNEFHGGAWWYHRNPVLNANYYFNNLSGTERQRQLLNQVGFKVGGPIQKDKFFFFLSLDSYRLPSALSTVSTALTDDSRQGIFTYDRIGGGTNTVNVLALAAANGFESSFDPVNKALLDQVAGAIQGLGRDAPTNPYTQRVRFNNPSDEKRYYPTLRLDYALNDDWRWEGIWNYQYATETRARPPRFPGFDLFGSNTSHRFSISSAVRTTFGATRTNEFRVGFTGGNLGRLPELIPGEYPPISIGGQPGFYYPEFPLVTSPLTECCGSRINFPQQQFMDNFSWTVGSHTLTFGGQFSRYAMWLEDYGAGDRGALPVASFGMLPSDPASSLFNATNFPGADSSVLSSAGALYALLTGRVSQVRSDIFADEKTREFVVGGPDFARLRQFELGLYVQDSWRMSPQLAVNAGLRWQAETPIRDQLNRYSGVGGLEGLLGPSTRLFAPGELTGRVTTYRLRDTPYPADYNNFAPNFGVAWNPTFNGGLLGTIFGRNPVFRAGYAIAYVQEGLRGGENVQLRNEGSFGNSDIVADRDYPAGSLLIRDGLPQPELHPAQAFDFPILATDAFRSFRAGEFADNLRSGYVQSWSVGMQRELSKSTVMEFRYVGNKGTKLWRHYDLNREDNIFENGFLQEFLNAQKNLAISREMGAGNNFRDQGLPGQAGLPIMAAAFGSATSSLFGNGTFITWLDEGRAGDFAQNFATNSARFFNLLAAGFPENFIRVNPYLLTLRFQDNGGWSTYNAFQVELRRRMSAGLLLQANYTWSHALSNLGNSTSSVASAVFSVPRTLRDVDFGIGPEEFNIYHAFKANWIYDLPFGSGKRWASGSRLFNHLIGGWSLAGITRIQSGSPVVFTNGGRGTFNSDDGGVDYGLRRQDIQQQMEVRQTPTGQVFFFPSDYIGADNRANPALLAPHATPGTMGDFFFFEGPAFVRADLTVAKKTYLGEDLNVEFRAEFLNAFNNINFLYARAASTVGVPQANVTLTNFGQINQAFFDSATTNDLGGRMIQLVLRINF